MKKNYVSPEVDFESFQIEDVITVSVNTTPVEGGTEGWIDIP